MEEFYKALVNAKHAVCFTGAGVSTLSGIKDFRSADGVYSKPWQGYSFRHRQNDWVQFITLPVFVKRFPSVFSQ